MISNYGYVELFGHHILITETHVNTWIIMAVLIGFAIVARIALNNFETIPTGFQNVVEWIVETFHNFTLESVGPTVAYIGPWFFSVFAFLLASAWLSIFGMRAPSADWATTFSFALVTFIMMVVLGIKHRRGSYLSELVQPHFLFLPINVLGELAKPISLSFRLFGNTLSGTMILALYYALTPWLAQLGIPALLHGFFDIVMGALQTYIFVILSLMYVRGAAVED